MSSMQYARRAYVDHLYQRRTYRAGKVTALGPAKTRRETLLDIKAQGILKRIWTTHAHGERIKIHIHIDGNEKPVLSGLAHELAAAAENISCEAIPLGGYCDHRSANLYLPIPFAHRLRIDAEPVGETGDGPYWQIDYALDCDEQYPLPRQEDDHGKPRIVYDHLPQVLGTKPRDLELYQEDIELKGAAPHNIWLEGEGVIRELAISGKDLDSLLLRIAFDPERVDEDRLDGPFQVDAPLRYLVGPFHNACVERIGSTAVIHFPMPFRSCAGIQLLAAMDYGSFRESYHFNVRIKYQTSAPDPEAFNYFHARFRCGLTNGYDGFECCATRGRGHFVGVHIFDTGHDHGGGDNVLFDAGTSNAGQLHGICGEDYFHMAYMRIWNRTPYSGCPSHSARYRHHLEMPIPFRESFVFNWGTFASQPAKAVAFWYQEAPAADDFAHDLIYTLTGPFDLKHIDALHPGAEFPAQAHPWPGRIKAAARSWLKLAQQGFVDLCHVHRRYAWPVPPSTGAIPANTCICAETRLWAAHAIDGTIRLGCDDPIRLYLNGRQMFADDGRLQPDPFKVFDIPVSLLEGVNTIRVVVGNTANFNWNWNGFSLVIRSDASDTEFAQLV